MVGTTLDIKAILQPDTTAQWIGNTFLKWDNFRIEWCAQKKEIRNYIFATDTRSTSNSKLPWKNSTTIPKLCQIRDNLHANYMAALFPQKEWMKWVGSESESETANTRKIITSYISNKCEQSNFKQTISQLIYDYIDYGNCFATTKWEVEKSIDPTTGQTVLGYVGPKVVRLSPYDIIFNPTASEFSKTPKMVRTLQSLGEIVKSVENYPTKQAKDLAKYAVDRAKDVRRQFAGLSQKDIALSEAFRVDGFSDVYQYFGSGIVELITFYGDLYDVDKDILYQDYIFTIIDRSYVLSMEPNPFWRREGMIKHAGWRLRPDNLYAQGPLDNLVGMQYRIDHLENLKADAFDLYAFPVIKVKGYVEDFVYGPNERVYVGDEGDIEFMRPDPASLTADNMIDSIEKRMEEMAGAPREAMGIRTAGEKTAYEVQNLQNASSRIFQNKIDFFEEMIIDPLLNDMLELARHKLPVSDLIRFFNDKDNVVEFIRVTKDDLAAAGKIKPMGAEHFAQRNLIIQNLTNFANSALGQDPAVNVHISGKRIAHAIEELFDLENYQLVSDNIRVIEQAQTQQLAQAAQHNLQMQSMTPGHNDSTPIPQVPQGMKPMNPVNTLPQQPNAPQGQQSVQR